MFDNILQECTVIMNSFLVLVAVVLTYLVQAHAHETYHSYHEEIGIPLAERVITAEKEMLKRGLVDSHNVNTRIVNGRNSTLSNRPYLGGLLIQLFFYNYSMCGSSLLTPRRTLTAGHCMNDGTHNARSVEIVHGSNTISFGGVRTVSHTFVVYPNFNYITLTHDIAMIYHTPIKLSNIIKPVALPNGYKNNTFVGKAAVATGYGRTSSFYCGEVPYDQHRREVTLQIIKNTECVPLVSYVTDKKICARGTATAIGVCQGDSGGPLIIYINGVQTLVGVTSFTIGYCDFRPSGFTRITEYMPWITRHMK